MSENNHSKSEDFKSKFQKNSFLEALKIALTEVIELEISTRVELIDSDISRRDIVDTKAGHLMHTRINIVDGDIDNLVGSEFVGGGQYQELRDFHLSQVKEGQAIINQNIESIRKLFEVVTNNLSRLRDQEDYPSL